MTIVFDEGGKVFRTAETNQRDDVPKLRFPDFKGHWTEEKFGAISTIVRGASPRPKGDPRYYGGTIPRLMVEDVARDGKYVFPKIDFLTQQGALLSRLCKAGTLTVVCSGTAKTVGQPSFLMVDACIHDGFLAMLEINDQFLPDFVYYQIERLQARAESSATHGGTFVNLTTSILKDYKRFFPEREEQEKITESISALDAKLGALRRKLQMLTHFKIGLIQKLFSQQLRFTRDDGTPFPEWKEKELGEVASRCTQKNTALKYMRVLTNSAVQGIVDQGDYFDKDIANVDNLGGYYIVKKGDFVYNPRISVSAPVGPIKRNDLGDGVMSPLYTVFRFHSEDTIFFEKYFQTTLWHDYMKSVANVGARHDRMAIGMKDFMALPLPFPHEGEQKKIANALTVMDKKVQTVAGQITKLEAFKRGLVQQMFV